MSARPFVGRLVSDYGMVLVLLLLCAFFSAATLAEQHPGGAAGGAALADDVAARLGPSARVLIVVGEGQEDAAFADALERGLRGAGLTVVAAVRGEPKDARTQLMRLAEGGGKLDAVVASQTAAAWPVLDDLGRKYPTLGDVTVLAPRAYHWPNFLKASNLLNVVNKIIVYAILAVGVTLVVITGGIDLSVGSLVALSSVTAAVLVRDLAGGDGASVPALVLCCAAAVGLCGLAGLFSGAMVTRFGVPPFIVTLAMMLAASGLAYTLAQGQSVNALPESFKWLGAGTSAGGVPHAVVLMLLLYLAAHFLMSRTVLGRHVYAVGGNSLAAKLAGIRVARVVLFVYTLSGALAGLGGIVLASQLKSGSPTYGEMYELWVIAAVVVGGASLSGGQGKVFGTLVGALVIGVIQNGMNLTGVTPYTQKVVLGAVILGTVLLDQLKKRGLSALAGRWRRPVK